MAALLARLNPLSSLIETFCEIPGARYIAPLFLGLFNIPIHQRYTTLHKW